MLRWLTAGESHGPALVAILEGLPAHVEVTTADLADALARRRLGYGRGARMKFEQDEVEFLGGVRHGRTLGGPVAIAVGNTEWPKWEQVMSPGPGATTGRRRQRRGGGPQRGRSPGPGPGHADLVGMQKYDFDEARPILERASARETAARVALGAVAARLPRAGRRRPARVSHVVALGGGRRPRRRAVPGPRRRRRASTTTRCAASTPTAQHAMVAEIDQAHKDGDTLGGVVEVVVARAAAGPRARTCTGTAASTPGSPAR